MPTSTAWLGPASTRLLIVLEFFKNKNTGKRKFINYSVQWKDLLFQLLHPADTALPDGSYVKSSTLSRNSHNIEFSVEFFLALLYCF